MDKSIKLVNELRVDLDNIPEDFTEQVRAAFEEFTECTAEDYRYEDKLRFIDLCAMRLHGNEEDYSIVKRLVLERTEWGFDEYGELPDADDYNAIEFMEWCVGEGRKMAQLNFSGNDKKIGEKKMRVLDLIISALYSPENVGKWVYDHNVFWHCSNCNYMITGSDTSYKYCPNCGTRIESEVADNG